MKKILAIVLAAVMLLSMTACGAAAKKDTYVVGICQLVQHDALDAALVASGTCGEGIVEQELFDDRFYAYVSPENPLFERNNIRIEDIDLKELVLLSPGHCMRDQIIELRGNGT